MHRATSARRVRTELTVRAYRGGYTPHEHEHAQVLLGLDGSLELDIDGHAAFVDASCGLVIPAGRRHDYHTDAPARVVVVDWESAKGTDRLRRFALPASWNERAESMSADDVLVGLAGLPNLQARRRLDLAPLARRVDAELHRDWTVDELAAICRFSPQRFRARFAELTGRSPLAWVRARRLDRAERLLRAGVPLETTALQVGYASASALCFALRRERGLGARTLRSLVA